MDKKSGLKLKQLESLSRWSNEVNTYPIIEKAWEEGKKIVVPKCNKGTRTMSFRQISNLNQLETVYMNLREPIPALTEEVNACEIDLLIVPGVAYTREENGLDMAVATMIVISCTIKGKRYH